MNYYFDIELTPQRDESDVVKTIKVKVNRWTNAGEMTQAGSTYVSNSGLKALWKETNKGPLIGSKEFTYTVPADDQTDIIPTGYPRAETDNHKNWAEFHNKWQLGIVEDSGYLSAVEELKKL